MTSYYQNQYATGPLVADMDAVFSQLDASIITSVGMSLGWLQVQTSAGYYINLTGTGLSITGGPGTWAFSGTVTQMNLFYDGAGSSAVELSGVNMALADIFASGTALFSGNDVITGGFGSQALYGYGGNDFLNGFSNGPTGPVHDTLYGGEGNDTFNLTLMGDTTEYDAVIFGGAGHDTIDINWGNLGSSAAILDGNHLDTQPTSVEALRFSAVDFVNGSVVFYKATVSATPGQGYLTLPGMVAIDGLKQVNAAAPGAIDLSAVAMTNEGSVFRYQGTSGADSFFGPQSFAQATDIAYYGHGGNDTLSSTATAVEVLVGGDGDDTYTAGLEDTITEVAGQGNDTLRRSLTTDLRDFVSIENLTLFGNGAIDGAGTSGNNIITGNAAANYLVGGGGTDILQGAGGNDTYLLGAGVTVIEGAAAGTDTALSFATATLATNVERLVLLGGGAINGTGNTQANRITGNDAANRLDGGALADTLIGDEGDDSYVYGAGDVIVEFAGEGTDTVESAVTVTLAAEVERLVLTGGAAINGTGNALANRMTGNGLANVLEGLAGADTLIGGLGSDTYIVDAADVVTETAGGGTADRVRVAASYVLAATADIEVLETTLASGTTAINLTGNALAQTLIGNAGANGLTGGLGVDTLVGGLGNDIYVVETTDVVTETAGGGTADRLRVAASYVLAATADIEVLETTLASGTTAINLTGNALAQTLIGNAGANVLNGLGGNDSLTGGAGADAFVFTTASAATNLETITDFSHLADTIRLDNAVFTALGAAAPLAATAFWANTTGLAHDVSDRIIFNTATGVLTYDSNGSTAGGTIVQFARLTLPATLDHTDFLVI